jgi:hypothetical protein
MFAGKPLPSLGEPRPAYVVPKVEYVQPGELRETPSQYWNGQPYETKLTPEEEKQYLAWAKAHDIPAYEKDYDTRGFWRAGQHGDPRAVTEVNPSDNKIHSPDIWKTPYHATFSEESQYARPDAPRWVDDRLVDQIHGTVIADETKHYEPPPEGMGRFSAAVKERAAGVPQPKPYVPTASKAGLLLARTLDANELDRSAHTDVDMTPNTDFQIIPTRESIEAAKKNYVTAQLAHVMRIEPQDDTKPPFPIPMTQGEAESNRNYQDFQRNYYKNRLEEARKIPSGRAYTVSEFRTPSPEDYEVLPNEEEEQL